MKLRNKKTGEICDFLGTYSSVPFIGMSVDYHNGEPKCYEYKSLAELNEEWEDYEPKEPLIKDEKIRKAVRAWVEINRDVSKVIYGYDTNKVYCEIKDIQSEARIRFNFLFIKELRTYEVYTITELCGEEKK